MQSYHQKITYSAAVVTFGVNPLVSFGSLYTIEGRGCGERMCYRHDHSLDPVKEKDRPQPKSVLHLER